MQIPLDQFEQIIDETILKRGFTYFNNGAVSEVIEISNNEFEANVTGTEEYTIRLKIRNNIIETHRCDCPYDLGPVCKHIVAFIFYLQQDELALNLTKPKRSKKRTKTVNQQIKELLKAISPEELVDFVSEHCKKDKMFRNYFFATFNHLCQDHSKEFYQQQIQTILKTAAGRKGWIDRPDMKYIYLATQPFLDNAARYLQKQNFENVFFIGVAIIEEMTKIRDHADDSDGDIGYFITSGEQLLVQLAQANISKTLKKDFFEYCITAFKSQLFVDDDLHIGILKIASDLVQQEPDADIILDCLDTIERSYEKEYAQAFKLKLLKKFKTAKEVEAFVNANISNPKIRTQEIEKAFEQKDFKRAMELAKDGIQCDQKSQPGTALKWYNWLLEIAIAQNNTADIIHYARYLLLDNFGKKQDYYKILKGTIHSEKWKDFLEEIISEITPFKKWHHVDLVREIYIKEKWWDRLFLLLKQNPSLENIQANEKYLVKDYAAQLIELYREKISSYLEFNVGRSHYRKACKYLRHMKKLGGDAQVNALIILFKQKYRQRRAFMEELNNV